MIGLNIIYEKDELLYSLKLSTTNEGNYSLDWLDFDNQSFDDLIDYLEFLEFDKYVFVSLGKASRLYRLVTYLQNFIDFPLQVLPFAKLSTLLTEESVAGIEKELSEHADYNKLKSMESSKIFQNGLNAFKTASYPPILSKGLLKHIWVDHLEKFLEENSGLLPYFAVNSAIYLDKPIQTISLPIIIKSLTVLEVTSTVNLTQQEIFNLLMNFRQTGEVTLNEMISDYGLLTGLSRFHSLVFANKTFYMDNAQKIPIGYSGDSYQKLFSVGSAQIAKQRLEDVSALLLALFPTLITINHIHDEQLTFITPFNDYHLKGLTNYNQSLSWLAFKDNQENFLFNLKNGRLFKVSDFIIETFEYIIKGKQYDTDSQERKQVMEMLHTYE